MAQVKAVNDATTITFTLSSTDAAAAANIRVATTLSFAGGRPSITINGKTYSAAAPTKIDSRGLTRGAYRGYGEVYDFALAAGVLVSGANTLAISCISGSTGDDFLEPNFVSFLLPLSN
jgi:rhamnogalacturonan endolyase